MFPSKPASISILFFFNDTATTEIYTLSLHDALPICSRAGTELRVHWQTSQVPSTLFSQHQDRENNVDGTCERSEEHTSELQSRLHLVCRLLLEKKKKIHAESSGHSPKTSLSFRAKDL